MFYFFTIYYSFMFEDKDDDRLGYFIIYRCRTSLLYTVCFYYQFLAFFKMILIF